MVVILPDSREVPEWNYGIVLDRSRAVVSHEEVVVAVYEANLAYQESERWGKLS